MSAPLFRLRSVSKTFRHGGHEVRAVDDVSLDVSAGECLAIVGESGSGKTHDRQHDPRRLSALLRRDLLARRQYCRRDATLPHRRAIQLVQQNPLSSLNPKRSVGASIRLALDVHDIGEKAERGAAGAARCSKRSGSTARSPPARLPRFRAASASASRSRGRSPASRLWSCSTSRPPRSTCWCRRAC